MAAAILRNSTFWIWATIIVLWVAAATLDAVGSRVLAHGVEYSNCNTSGDNWDCTITTTSGSSSVLLAGGILTLVAFVSTLAGLILLCVRHSAHRRARQQHFQQNFQQSVQAEQGYAAGTWPAGVPQPPQRSYRPTVTKTGWETVNTE